MNTRFLPALLCAIVMPLSAAHAQWVADGKALSTFGNNVHQPVMVPDGAGGAIAVWYVNDGASSYNIRAQHVSATGTVFWLAAGAGVCTATGVQDMPNAVSDGAGGVIVTWEDLRGSDLDIYAQRLDATGTASWTVNGVALCTSSGNQLFPVLASDGAGGAIVAWYDLRNGFPDIYAQRIDASGNVVWTANGVALCTATGNQTAQTIVADGRGGAIVAWADTRNSSSGDIYAQRVDASGAVQWTANGVAACLYVGGQGLPAITTDGAAGAIVAWRDYRNGATADIYVQRVDSTGVNKWLTSGTSVCMATDEQTSPRVASVALGGAIVTWSDHRSGVDKVYAQWVGPTGTGQWTYDGVPVCGATGVQAVPRGVVALPNGDAIVAWEDFRDAATSDIYAQRINFLGDVQWGPDGVAVCTADQNQKAICMLPDIGGGAIIAWEDYRGTGAPLSAVYALRLSQDGMIPTGVAETPALSAITLSAGYPNPFSAGTALELTLPDEAAVTAEVFDAAGRRVRRMELGHLPAGASRIAFDGRDDHARNLPSGVYFYRVSASAETVTRKIVIQR